MSSDSIKTFVNCIDKTSFEPAYHQLARLIEEKIKRGELQPGDKIESETLLSERLGLSRMTVRRAFEILAKKGLTYSERGRGTFVARQDLNDIIFKVTEFSQDMREKGLFPEARLLEEKVISASKTVAQKLHIYEGQSILYLSFLKIASGKPMVFERKYIIIEDDPQFSSLSLKEEEMKEFTFSDFVEKVSGFVPISSTTAINATVINKEEAEILQVNESTPGFFIEQTLYIAEQKPVGLGIYVYRGDKYIFTSSFNY